MTVPTIAFASASPSAPCPDLCAKLKELTKVVVQIAVRVFFILGSILLSAAVLPLHWHAVAIPAVAIGTTALASLCFPSHTHQALSSSLIPLPPLVRPIEALSAEAPRPITNAGNDCWLNSLIHLLESDPAIANWLRHPLTPTMDMAAFGAFLAGYGIPEDAIARFREYVDQQALLRNSILDLFKTFLADNQEEAFRHMKSIYDNLLGIQQSFAPFLATYDQAVQNKGHVDTSHALRSNLASQVPSFRSIQPNQRSQMDPAELMTTILDCLPNQQKLHFGESRLYNTEGLPNIQDNSDGVTETEERHGFISLSIGKENTTQTLAQLLQEYCDEQEQLERTAVDGTLRLYPTRTRRVFMIPPPVLRFQVKRFDNELSLPQSPPQEGWLTSLLAYFWPQPPLVPEWRIVKKDTPIEVPPEITVAERQYRLVSFVNHVGDTPQSGHYTAARIVNGNQYFMNDQYVTLADQSAWDERLRHAYLLCYVPVPE